MNSIPFPSAKIVSIDFNYPKAWLGYACHKDGPAVRVCSHCDDWKEAAQRAQKDGFKVVWAICKPCAAKQIAKQTGDQT